MVVANNMQRRNDKPKGSSRDIKYVDFLHSNEGESVLPTTDWHPKSITLHDAPLGGISELEKKRLSSNVLQEQTIRDCYFRHHAMTELSIRFAQLNRN
jgi:hypothetical protein